MAYVPNVISTILFESDHVIIFKIPPGDEWDLKQTNIVWQGRLRLIEQESIQEEPSNDIIKPFDGLRAKIELFNRLPTGDEIWAEIWYNPVCQLESDVSLANNGQETIQLKNSSRFYKIIAQLPGSGYHPLRHNYKDNHVQVALGLKFNDTHLAISFQESLMIYKRRFRNYEDQYQSDINQKDQLHLMKSNLDSFYHKIENHLNLDSVTNHVSELDLDDNDDFGDFVTS